MCAIRSYTSGSWRRSQRSFGRREAGQRSVAGQLDQAREPDALLDLGALGRRPLVVPEDRRPQHPLVRVEGDEAVHLAGEADAGDLGHASSASASLAARAQSAGSCSAQPGRGVESG